MSDTPVTFDRGGDADALARNSTPVEALLSGIPDKVKLAPPVGSRWEALDKEFSYLPKEVVDLEEAIPLIASHDNIHLLDTDQYVYPSLLPAGWYYAPLGGAPTRRVFIRFARLLCYRRRAAQAAPGEAVAQLAAPGATAKRQAYAPKMDEAYYLIVNEAKSIAEVATLLNIRVKTIEAWCRQGNWLGRRIEAEHMLIKAEKSESVAERATTIKTMLLECVDRSCRRLEQMESALQKKWDASLADTEELVIRDAKNVEHKRRVTKASPATLNALLDLNGRLLKQLQELSNVGTARMLEDAGRLKKSRISKKNRNIRLNAELLGRGTAIPSGDKE